MKTQNMNLMKVATCMMMVAALLLISSCGSNQEQSSSKNEQAQASKATVKPPNMDIHTATLLGDLDAIKQHIAAGSNLDEGEPTLGSTPLISAAVFGKTEIAKALIDAGADVNIKNNEGSCITLLKIQLVRYLRHNLYSFIIFFITSTNLIQSATWLIGDTSRFAGPLHQQTNVKF